MKTGRSRSAFLSTGIGCIVVVAGIWIFGCQQTASRGEKLARAYCSTCHIFPEPGLLTKHVWSEFVLPQMAFRMGFPNLDIVGRISPADLNYVMETLPERPMVTPEEFKAIRQYYSENAPDHLPVKQGKFGLVTQFAPEAIAFRTPFLTLLESDTVHQRLYIGTQNSWLFILDHKLRVVDSTRFPSPPSYIHVENGSRQLSLIGELMPNDQRKGQIIEFKDLASRSRIIFDSLRRPVHFTEADINSDGRNDFIVSNFGNYVGNLSLYTSHKSGFLHTVLSTTPGARKTIVRDLNGDGLKDILALFAQGDERLVLYLNKPDGTFMEKVLLRFPPVNGTNYFEMADFNDDGHNDLVITNGDNGDFSIIHKPYHGVRIFLNDGANEFREEFFFPMPGASQAMARDFDEDGDLDIAAISFFPDFENSPEHSFIYLENKGGEFLPQYTPAGAYGRWLLMTTWDYDADGDEDILLGSSSYQGLGANRQVYEEWAERAIPVLLLENKLR